MADLFGIGIYDQTEAHRLSGAPTQTIQRWLRGYTARGVEHDPMWRPEIEGDELALSFRDMLQLRSAYAFRKKGVSAQLLRKAIVRAGELIDSNHPFSTARFRTDGASIMLEIDQEQGEPELIDVFTNQREMHAVIEQSLRHVEFEGLHAHLWRPLGRDSGVVLDPARSFGQPIDEESGIPTRTLAVAVDAEGDLQTVAKLYELPLRSVSRAVRFEGWLDQAA